mgnify:CR=1 FL=1
MQQTASRLGFVAGFEFWMSNDQFEYWQHTLLTLDVVPGRGSSFSIEIPTGYRFIIRSRIFNDEELEQVWAGKKTAKEALDAAVKRGNEQLERFQKANK